MEPVCLMMAYAADVVTILALLVVYTTVVMGLVALVGASIAVIIVLLTK
jgi:hypothetical protein